MLLRVPLTKPGQGTEPNLRVDVVHDVIADVARREPQRAEHS